MNILVSCFKPFNKEKENYSELVLNNLNDLDIDKITLDVLYKEDSDKIISLLNKKKYDYVFLLGEARSRDYVSIETMAENLDDAKIPDNNGIIKNNEEIIKNNDNYLSTNMDLFKIIPILNNDLRLSCDGGTFVCNDLYYRVLHYVYQNDINTKVLFIHLPKINDDINKYVNIIKEIIISFIK